MRTLTLDMRQYDCPFIDTTDDYEVSFTTLHWDFKQDRDGLETRMVVDAADEGAMENGLRALTDHPMLEEHDLLSKRGDAATIRTTIQETDAMHAIRDHGGYITGPFHIEDGSETWNVGFDTTGDTEAALSALERDNDFDVVNRTEMDLGVLQRLARNVDTAATLVEACQDLSEVERETLRSAIEEGYFDTPRDATLSTLAEEFDISSPAVSKNLRRGERKVLQRLVTALDELN